MGRQRRPHCCCHQFAARSLWCALTRHAALDGGQACVALLQLGPGGAMLRYRVCARSFTSHGACRGTVEGAVGETVHEAVFQPHPTAMRQLGAVLHIVRSACIPRRRCHERRSGPMPGARRACSSCRSSSRRRGPDDARACWPLHENFQSGGRARRLRCSRLMPEAAADQDGRERVRRCR